MDHWTKITSVDELAMLYRQPGPLAHAKCIHRLDPHCRAFIAHSSLVFLASSDRAGRHDVSPRGDAPGFVAVTDDETFLIPDRMGNNRLDTFRNVIEQPFVAAIFVIPGVAETLRVEGEAAVVTGPGLDRFAVKGRVPPAALMVSVRQAFLHCAKAFVRSKVWHDTARSERPVPSLAAMLHDHLGHRTSENELQATIDHSMATKLY